MRDNCGLMASKELEGWTYSLITLKGIFRWPPFRQTSCGECSDGSH